MNRFGKIFSGNKKALIVLDCAGAPDMQTSEKRIAEILNAGADIVELGIPFSDPMADGDAIQKAYQQALQNGADLSKIINMLKKLRQNYPAAGLIISGYSNIFLQYGYEKLFADLAALEIDALRILDLPCEEFAEIAPFAEKYNIQIVIAVSKSTPPERLSKLLGMPGSIVYCDDPAGADAVRKLTTLPIAMKHDNSFNAMIIDEAAVKTPCDKLAGVIAGYKNKL